MWKDINSNYSVSINGDVKNNKTGRILKPGLNSKGYYRVCIGKTRSFIHRLVALAFIPNPNDLPQVNHINMIKTDNNIINLEWCTNQYNNKQAFSITRKSNRARLYIEDVKIILQELHDKSSTVKELAIKYNVAVPTIYAIKQGLNCKRLLK